MSQKTFFETKKISKSFGPTRALVEVDLEIKPGEIHGLIGENGSGKSTLASIIAAIQKADSGDMTMEEKNYAPENIISANNLGVSIVLQEQDTILGLSVASNLFLAREEEFVRGGFLDLKRMYETTRKILGAMGAGHVDPELLVDFLSFEDRKIIEIARAMYTHPRLLIIDETTTALTVKGRAVLYEVVRSIRKDGGSVLFISHDMDEIIDICNRLTVLKDGRKTATLSRDEFNMNEIRKLMVGREMSRHYYRIDNEASFQDEIVLEVKNISYRLLKDVSFELKKGEILGIGGLTNSGMHDLGKILFGLIKPNRGKVYANGGRQIKNWISAIRNGISYISKDRDKESLMSAGSIRDNICSASWRDMATKIGVIPRRRERVFARKWADMLKIKMVGIEQFCTELSGGNKQKVVLAKWLGKDSDILILDCPTRGIDIGVKAEIYRLMERLKAEGKSIIIISEELTEVIGMSDHMLILKNGMVTGKFKRDALLTEEKLIEYMI